jgi:predicted permease
MRLTEFVRDVRFGVRLLWKSPAFTLISLLALGLGIGGTTAIFSVVYATLLAPLPYHDPNQLVMVWSRIQGNKNVVSAGDFLDWKNQGAAFQGLAAWGGRSLSLSTSEQPEQVQAAVTTPGWCTLIGFDFQLGRDFLPEEGTLGKEQVAVLSHKLWEQRFGADRGIIGRAIRIDGRPYTVVGVIAPGPADRVQNKMYVPLAIKPEQNNHDFHWLLVLGRLKPGVTLAQANANMEGVAKHIAEAYPSSNKGWGVSVEPLKNNFLSKDVVSALWLLLGAVCFVLLIACANVANLLLARGLARQREVAVRASLGASAGRLFGQLLTESLVLALMGGALGVALASVLLKVITATMPPYTLPSEADVRLNVPVLLFTLAAALLSGVMFGCAPAWQAMRLNLNETLKEGGRGSLTGSRHRLRRALVATEFALALTLLAGGGLAIHSLMKLTHVDLGFRRDHLLTFSLPVPSDRLKGREQVERFYRELLEKIHAIPGVAAVSASTGMPVAGTGFGMPFYFAGKPFSDPSARPGAGFSMVTPEYFKTFGIQIDRGRAFNELDRAGSAPVAIVNDVFVKKYLSGVDPLAQRIVVEELIPGVEKLGPEITWQIVGVYRNVKNGGPHGDGFPEIDVPFWQSPWQGSVMAARTHGEPAGVSKSIAAVIRSMDPDLPMAEVKTMDQMVDEALGGDRFGALLFGGFAAMALVLAAVGIYGVMSFAVAQRTHEIGLRMALGATGVQVLRLVLAEGLITAAIGTVVGLVGAYFVGRLMQALLFGVTALDYPALSAVAAILLAAALLACYVPARRASAVDPMVALREE